jgi:molybdate transport system substrate-binding protein
MKRALASAILATSILVGASANAADIKVISAGAVRTLISGMIDDYKKKTGDNFDFTVGPTGFLRDTIASGKPADLLITSAPLMAEIEKTGKLVPGSRVDVGRVGLGVVMREGVAPPDLSTVPAFKQALLNAKSVAHTAPELGGTSSVHLLAWLKKEGIADVIARKAVHGKGGIEVSRFVADGKAEIGVTLISEILPVKGARLAAPLPGTLQLWTVYAAAIPATSKEPAAAARSWLHSRRRRWHRGGPRPASSRPSSRGLSAAGPARSAAPRPVRRSRTTSGPHRPPAGRRRSAASPLSVRRR